jgi:hypothetical protein
MLVQKREQLEGTRIFGMLLNLDTSHYAVSKNYQELSSAFAFYEGNLEIWDVKKRQKLDFFLRELSRLLHNYLSSTFSLIRHNVKLCNELDSVELNQEYSKAIKALELNDCYWFVKDLRNSAQHVGLPILSAQLSFSRNQGNPEVKHRILLDKEILLNWKEWKKGSKNYINSHKEIDLKLVINEYQLLVRNFYVWFNKTIVQRFSKQLQEFAEIDREICKLSHELFNKS